MRGFAQVGSPPKRQEALNVYAACQYTIKFRQVPYATRGSPRLLFSVVRRAVTNPASSHGTVLEGVLSHALVQPRQV